MADHMGSSMI